MSGGNFNYDQYRLDDMADNIERFLAAAENPVRLFPGMEDRFVATVNTLKRVRKMVDRVDWFISGDDGEVTFLRRWREEGLDD